MMGRHHGSKHFFVQCLPKFLIVCGRFLSLQMVQAGNGHWQLAVILPPLSGQKHKFVPDSEHPPEISLIPFLIEFHNLVLILYPKAARKYHSDFYHLVYPRRLMSLLDTKCHRSLPTHNENVVILEIYPKLVLYWH